MHHREKLVCESYCKIHVRVWPMIRKSFESRTGGTGGSGGSSGSPCGPVCPGSSGRLSNLGSPGGPGCPSTQADQAEKAPIQKALGTNFSPTTERTKKHEQFESVQKIMTQQTEKLRAELSVVQASETNLRSKLAEMQEVQRCEEAKMRRCSELVAREAERFRQSEAKAAKSIKEAEGVKKNALQYMRNVFDKAIKDCQAAGEEAKTERATVATLRTELLEKTAQVAEFSQLAGTQDALAITSGSSPALSGLQLAVCENVDRHFLVGLPGRQLLNTFLIFDYLADTIYKQASKVAGVDRHPGTTDTNPKVSFQTISDRRSIGSECLSPVSRLYLTR